MTAKIIIQNMELTVSSRLKNEGVKFPNTEKTDRTLHNEFAVTLHANEKKHSFNYYDSHKAFEEGKIELTDNDMLFAARSIFDDAACGNDSFEEFCSNLGYDQDSRRAEKIYNECKKGAKKLNDLGFTDFYAALDAFREAGIE